MAFMEVVELAYDFEIYGLKTRTKNADEMSGNSKITKLWKDFLSLNSNDTDEIYAAYHEYESDFSGHYSLLVGTQSLPRGAYDKITIKQGKYAVFSIDSTDAKAVRDLWLEIWKFFESSNLKRAYEIDFEKHLENKVEIYISIV